MQHDEEYTPILIPSGLATQVSDVELAALIRAHVQKKAEYAYAGIDYDGLTSGSAPPLVAPARVKFRNVKTGEWIEGVSEPLINPNHFRIELDVRAYAPCRHRQHWKAGCDCEKELTGIRTGPANLSTIAFASFVRAGIMGTTTSTNDITPTSRSLTKAIDGGTNTLQVCAGTGATGSTFADTNLQTQTDTPATGTVGAIGTPTTNQFTVTGSITAGAARNYTEVGLKSITTTTTWTFLLTRDTFSALSVSSGGTLAVTYTLTFT